MNIIDMHGRQISSNQKQRPITKAQAGAILISELDIAIERWNTAATQQAKDDTKKAHLFKIEFIKNQYAKEVQETVNQFGYALLKVTLKHNDEVKTIYEKALGFVKESELNNTNAYYPDMVMDLMAFLIASGLMYNLAISDFNPAKEEIKNGESDKPKSNTKGKPRNRNTTGSSEGDNSVSGEVLSSGN